MKNQVTETLQNLRVRYRHSSLDASDCPKDPSAQLEKWLREAIDGQCDEPNAMTLSTCVQGKPRARVVLLKGIADAKLFFYTNYKSAKGAELFQNDSVAMTLLWLPLQRQVRIEGRIQFASPKDSDDYFARRPRGSQLGAIASPQSQIVSSRQELEKLFLEAEEKFQGIEILPRPIHWGGYSVIPDYFEFWQGRDNRMHDRIVYTKNGADWEMNRLAP